MRNKMNMKNKTHKCVPRNSQINLSAQEFESFTYKSQEMPNLRLFLARFWLSDNRMTMILEIILCVF